MQVQMDSSSVVSKRNLNVKGESSDKSIDYVSSKVDNSSNKSLSTASFNLALLVISILMVSCCCLFSQCMAAYSKKSKLELV